VDSDPPIQHAVMERDVQSYIGGDVNWSKRNEVTIIYYYGVGSEGATGAPPCCINWSHTPMELLVDRANA